MEHPTVSFERRIIPAYNETTILTDDGVLREYPNYVDYVCLLTAERRLPAHTLVLDY
jgi:hypothetical protein